MDRVVRRGPLVRAPGALKGGHFRNCQHFCRRWGGFVANIKKLKGGKFLFSEQNFTVLKKTERGTIWDFPTSILSQNSKKIEGGPFEEKNFRKKSLAVPKKIRRGDPLVSPGMVCYAGKQEKPFWFSSLYQIVQFGAILFCRTFVELFWSVRVDWKKRKATIIVAFHFMKRRLKTCTNDSV